MQIKEKCSLSKSFRMHWKEEAQIALLFHKHFKKVFL